MPDLVPEGELLVKQWQDAKHEVKRICSMLNTSECGYMNATNALGKWMLPGDAKPGESFSIWYRDALITVKQIIGGEGNGNIDYAITVRSRGKNTASLD